MSVPLHLPEIPALRLDSPHWATMCVDRMIYRAHTGRSAAYVDRLLDFKYALLLGSDAESVLAAFFEVWRRFERQEYATFYKLRRWLEQRIVVHRSSARIVREETAALKLGYATLEILKRSLQNEWFQADTRLESLQDVALAFRWLPLRSPE